MSKSILVTYSTLYGSTQQAAETVAATLRESGREVDLQPMRDVRTLEGYRAIVLGTPMYLGALHKDTQRFLSHHGPALAQRRPAEVRVAVFALGPTMSPRREDEWQACRALLDQELSKYPWLAPVAVGLFGGKYDPATLSLAHRLLAGLPASPLHNLPASDLRDLTAVRAWARELAAELQPALDRMEAQR